MTSPIWTRQARVELARQTDYVAGFDPAAAERINDRVERRADWLAAFPHAGARIGRGRARTFRVLRTPLTLIYEPFGDTVLILRIVHAAQNWRSR